MCTSGRSESNCYALPTSLFFSSSMHMVWLDGRIVQWFGPGPFGLFDAAANLAAALFFSWWRLTSDVDRWLKQYNASMELLAGLFPTKALETMPARRDRSL